MTPFDLTDVGLPGVVVTIEGTLTVLHYSPGAPIVFMFDEHHTTPPCIQQNIDNAERIIAQVPVDLIGVESHCAKCRATAGSLYNKHPEFADHFVAAGYDVFGVEHKESATDLETDVYNTLWPDTDAHPFNFIRSHYFLAVLFRTRRDERFSKNLFLNAGKKHIDHIEAMLQRNEIEEIAGEVASYVRVRSAAYPAGP